MKKKTNKYFCVQIRRRKANEFKIIGKDKLINNMKAAIYFDMLSLFAKEVLKNTNKKIPLKTSTICSDKDLFFFLIINRLIKKNTVHNKKIIYLE